ncbi:nucleoside-triphosphatase [uncultured Clostridium sp.]|uniref:nucleoside-triphosphatase n=1 Tax=uncultured Clostridium sp. TaxID=59620 RepID=UPI0028EDAB2F|nr:nucleoside-triphosphatase [uncultured Clostridium sp.]
MYKNILITGRIQCGKSTLINKILNELTIAYSGYRTLPYYKNKEKDGYYIEGVNLKSKLKDKISVNASSQKCIALVDGFDITGVEILKMSIEDEVSKIILLDEIGVLEKSSLKFIEEIHNCLDSDKLVIGVLKKKDDEFLNRISEREDTFIVDIENSTEEERRIMKKQIIEYIESVFKCSYN